MIARSDQIKWLLCKCYEPFPFSKDQMSKIATKDTSQSIATTYHTTSHLGASWNVSATYLVGQCHLGTSSCITRTSHIGRFCLLTSKASQRRLNRSVLLTYQLKHRDDISIWSRLFKLVIEMGQFLLGTRQ